MTLRQPQGVSCGEHRRGRGGDRVGHGDGGQARWRLSWDGRLPARCRRRRGARPCGLGERAAPQCAPPPFPRRRPARHPGLCSVPGNAPAFFVAAGLTPPPSGHCRETTQCAGQCSAWPGHAFQRSVGACGGRAAPASTGTVALPATAHQPGCAASANGRRHGALKPFSRCRLARCPARAPSLATPQCLSQSLLLGRCHRYSWRHRPVPTTRRIARPRCALRRTAGAHCVHRDAAEEMLVPPVRKSTALWSGHATLACTRSREPRSARRHPDSAGVSPHVDQICAGSNQPPSHILNHVSIVLYMKY